MKLQTVFLLLSMFILASTAYRLNRFNRRKYNDDWMDKEDPERDIYRKLGILDQSVFESPNHIIILPRPYVNPNKDKYKYKNKKRPTTRPQYPGTSASESEGERHRY